MVCVSNWIKRILVPHLDLYLAQPGINIVQVSVITLKQIDMCKQAAFQILNSFII